MTNRNTKQRDVITQAILSANRPLTVNEILKISQEKLPSLGIATVYRTIKLLCKKNQIHPILLDGETLYEASGKGHHHHFSCNSCKKVFTLHICPVNLPAGSIYENGFIVQSHELTLYGLCPDCANNTQSDNLKPSGK